MLRLFNFDKTIGFTRTLNYIEESDLVACFKKIPGVQ